MRWSCRCFSFSLQKSTVRISLQHTRYLSPRKRNQPPRERAPPIQLRLNRADNGRARIEPELPPLQHEHRHQRDHHRRIELHIMRAHGCHVRSYVIARSPFAVEHLLPLLVHLPGHLLNKCLQGRERKENEVWGMSEGEVCRSERVCMCGRRRRVTCGDLTYGCAGARPRIALPKVGPSNLMIDSKNPCTLE